jgi:hypothetical protein
VSKNNLKKEFNLEEAKKLYLENGWSAGQIAKLYGFKSQKSVADKLKADGVVLRTGQNLYTTMKSYSDDIFESIDSEWKGYFLGLLLTDGWVTGDSTIGYSSVDKDVVEYLSELTGKNIQFVDKSGPQLSPQGTIVNRKPEYRLVLSSKKIVEDLKRLSVVNNKTHILEGPKLTSDELIYLPQILRGIIDGDGTLGFPSNHVGSIYFRITSASEKFIDWCIWALKVLGMRNINKRNISENFWEINSAQAHNVEILVHSIYAEEFGMTRKRNKLLENYSLR